jgi:hypothetical protein
MLDEHFAAGIPGTIVSEIDYSAELLGIGFDAGNNGQNALFELTALKSTWKFRPGSNLNWSSRQGTTEYLNRSEYDLP